MTLGTALEGIQASHSTAFVCAFDYDSSGKLDHLVVCSPFQLAPKVWILRHNLECNEFYAGVKGG